MGMSLTLLCLSWGCASTPSAPVQAATPVVAPATRDEKMAWTFRLEQSRTLRDIVRVDVAAAATPPAAAVGPTGGFAPATSPDLVQLARDPDAAIRSRAALAIGRVGMVEGASALLLLQADPDPTVRANAAFALGLLGDRTSVAALTAALADQEPLVRARAIEGLGLIGDDSAAPAIAKAASGCAPLVSGLEPDDEEWPKSTEIELCRLALFSLARLKRFEPLAQVAIGADGQAVSRWWPVAYALQRVGDPRAAPYLVPLASTGVYTSGFALRGLAAYKHPSTNSLAAAVIARRDADIKVRVAAVRAMGQMGDRSAVTPLLGLLEQPELPLNLTVEAIDALGMLRAPEAFDHLLDFFSHPSPAVRSAALAAAAKSNSQSFLVVLAGLGRDPEWSVRAALAAVLGTLPADRVTAGIEELLEDTDPRVHGPALEALAAVRATSASARVLAALEAEDFVERETAARLVAELKPDGGIDALEKAYARGQSDASYSARGAAIEALAALGGERALAVVRQALHDREWPVRTHAAELLAAKGEKDAAPERPALVRQPPEFFSSAAVLRPPYSPHAFVETRRGTVELQLDVIAAPFTVLAFIEQARTGLFNGLPAHRVVPGFVFQAGDPRGDGNGGPGYTIRDELSTVPYLRGSVGIALAGKDTGGSQWFITLSPQPHLDAKYTNVGRVVNGWDVLDRLSPWDVIERVRIWDGVELR